MPFHPAAAFRRLFTTTFLIPRLSPMPSHSENTRRIAKNTLMLYVRMLFGMKEGVSVADCW